MPCCCIKTLNLCSVPVCGLLEIEVAAIGISGSGANNYTLVLDYFQTQITLTEEQTDGENIHFDVSGLNENMEFIGKVYDSNGDLVSITIGDDIFDCIKFKTVMNVLL